MEETNLGVLIEKAVKDIQQQKEKEAELDAEAASDEEALENELFGDNGQNFLNDEDFSSLKQLEEEEEEADDDYLESLLEDKYLK